MSAQAVPIDFVERTWADYMAAVKDSCPKRLRANLARALLLQSVWRASPKVTAAPARTPIIAQATLPAPIIAQATLRAPIIAQATLPAPKRLERWSDFSNMQLHTMAEREPRRFQTLLAAKRRAEGRA